jgi:fluoroquinolone transport system ATP-binding protein
MIQVRDLEFTYPGAAEPAVRGISFAVTEGEIFGFLGPNGAGKSTTQKLLIGLLDRFQGKVRVLGKKRRAWDDSFFEQVGVGFEQPNHYGKLSGRENLELFASLYGGGTEDPDALLALVDLSEAADRRVSDYSKGMQMRLSLARALLNRPRLIFLDEPTAGLDPVSKRNVEDILRQQRAAGRTIFLTTHDMVVAESLCDRVAFIVDGQIALIDSPRALKLQQGERRLRVEYHVEGGADSAAEAQTESQGAPARSEGGSVGTEAGTSDEGSRRPTQQAEFPLEGLADNPEFLALLRERSIETIHSQEATLEDIFVRATGRQLR